MKRSAIPSARSLAMYETYPSKSAIARKPTAMAAIEPRLWRAFFRTLRQAMRRSGGEERIPFTSTRCSR